MPRWRGSAVALAGVLASPLAVRAQPAGVAVTATTDQPPAAPAVPPAMVYGAMPGGLNVSAAEVLPRGTGDVELLSGFGYRGGVLGPHHRFGRAIGDVSAAFGVLDALTVGISLDGYYDRHYGFPSGGASGCGATCDDGYVGNPHLYARLAKPFGKLALGAQLGVWVPGNKAPSVRFGATSVDLLALASLAAGPGTLSLDAGFRLDNSAKSVDNLTSLSLQDRMSLGISEYDEVLGGVQYRLPVGRGWLAAEGSLEAFVGTPPSTIAPLADGKATIRVAAEAGYRLAPRWTVLAYVQLAREPGVTSTELMRGNIPIFPYEPGIGAGLGLTARLGGHAGAAIAGPPPCWETPGGCKPDEQPLFGTISGTVIDQTGKPLVGAHVTVKGHTYGGSETATTQSDGTYHVGNVEVGRRITTASKAGPTTQENLDETSLDVSVELADRRPGAATVTSPKAGDNTVPPITLEPALPPGELEGIVRTQAGKPVAGAVISVSPGHREIQSGADGNFSIDLPPATYHVTIKAPGLAKQELDLTIEPNSVVIKELVLHR